MVRGVVREFSPEEGFGVIDSPETPGGCWMHYSSVAIPGYKSLTAGDEVELEWEAAQQDGYAYRATRVWPAGSTPYDVPREAGNEPCVAYRSVLTIHRDDGRVERYEGGVPPSSSEFDKP